MNRRDVREGYEGVTLVPPTTSSSRLPLGTLSKRRVGQPWKTHRNHEFGGTLIGPQRIHLVVLQSQPTLLDGLFHGKALRKHVLLLPQTIDATARLQFCRSGFDFAAFVIVVVIVGGIGGA